MCAIQIDGNDGSDADEHKDSRYFLTKIDKKERLGERENGKPVKFFDDSDAGILQSNVFLQDLPASEFKEGSDGSLNSKWANYLKNGAEKYIIPGMPVDLGWELTWNASFNGTELEIAKETEKSWAQSHLDAWTTIGVFLADFPPFKIGDSITKVGMDLTLSDQFISVQNTILNNTDELNENNIGTKDGLFSTLEKIISDSTTLSELPGEADTIILSKYKYHEAGISPGNIIDIINEIIGDKDTVDSNLANFSSINSFIQSFKNAFEANIGYIVSNEPMGVKYTHKENTEEIYYSDPKAASYNNEEVLPEGENLEDYDSEIYKFPIFDDFRENIFGEVKGGDTIVSGIQYINELIKNKSLINLVDTPTGYIGHSGEYLIVNTGESGIYFTGIEKIAQDLTDYGFIGGDGITGFTGLYDTPTGYQEHSGHYLVVNDGETGVHFTGIEKIAQDLTNYGFVGGEGSNHFTGLQDTPSDYNSGHYLRSTDNGIEYAEPSELGQDVITNTTGLASGYLRIDDDGTGIVIVDRETFKGEIDLQTDFTGLQDTPSDYSEGDYLRSTSNGLEYVTTSGLAQDIGDEIVNNIVTGDLLGFTGLNDTPTGYETGKFVRVNSAGDAVEYSDISFLNDVIDAPESQLVSGFLKLDKDGKLVWSPATTDGDVSFTITGATHFTGLLDTPNTYDNNKFLAFDAFKNQITGVELKLASSFYGPADVINNPHDLSEVGDKKILEYHRTQEHGYEIKWVDQITGITTFSGLNGTPADYQEGKYLRSTADGLEYVDITGLAEEVSAEIDFPEGATGFTGLHDTPTDYQGHSGDYLVVNDGETGVHFTGIEKIASDLTDYGFGGGDGASNFTGLEDTPSDYNNGSYLKSTANGLEYAGVVPSSYSDILSLPSSPSEHEGEVVKVGCDIYLSCNGEWQKLDTSSQDDIPSSYPDCVQTQSEMIEYDKYEKEFSDSLAEQELINTINGIETNVDIKNVCLFNQDLYSDIILDENASWENRGDIGGIDYYKYGRISRNKNQFAFVALKVVGSSSSRRISWEYFDVVTLDKNTQTITNSQRFKKQMNSPTYVTHNFQWISMINYIDGADTTNYDDSKNTQVRRIEIYKLNSSTNTYELHDIINKPDGWNDQAWDGNSLKNAKISEDGNQLLVQTLRDPTSGSTGQRLRNFVRNGDSWSQVNTFTLPDDSAGLTIKNVNKDFTKIALSVGWIKYIYNINYETSTLENVSTLSFEGNAWNINENFDTLLIGIRNGSGTSDGSFYVYKLNIENNTWRITNNGNELPTGGLVSTTRYASISEDGNIVMVPAGNIYYYNSSNDTWSVMIGSLGGGTSGNLLSWDGSTVVRDDGNVFEIYFSQIPKTNTNLYNNSVYIEESTYKWGIFDGPTNINLNGDIDTNCTFTEWKSSEATFGNSTNLNTTADITNNASITGVFNCG